MNFWLKTALYHLSMDLKRCGAASNSTLFKMFTLALVRYL